MSKLTQYKNTKTLLLVAAILAAVLPALVARANPMTGAGVALGQYFNQLKGYQNQQDPAAQMTLQGTNFTELMHYAQMVQIAQKQKNGVDFSAEFDVGQDFIPITPEERVREMAKSETQANSIYSFSNSASISDSLPGMVSEGEKHSSINESFSRIYTFEDFMKEPVSPELARAIQNTPPLPAINAWNLEAIGLPSKIGAATAVY